MDDRSLRPHGEVGEVLDRYIDDLERVVRTVQRQHTSHTGAVALHCSTCRALSLFYAMYEKEGGGEER